MGTHAPSGRLLRCRWRADACDLPQSLAGWIGGGDLFDFCVHRSNLLFEIFPLAPEQAETAFVIVQHPPVLGHGIIDEECAELREDFLSQRFNVREVSLVYLCVEIASAAPEGYRKDGTRHFLPVFKDGHSNKVDQGFTVKIRGRFLIGHCQSLPELRYPERQHLVDLLFDFGRAEIEWSIRSGLRQCSGHVVPLQVPRSGSPIVGFYPLIAADATDQKASRQISSKYFQRPLIAVGRWSELTTYYLYFQLPPIFSHAQAKRVPRCY